MKAALRWMFSRKLVVGWLCIATVLDIVFTAWVLSLFDQEVINGFQAESNPILRSLFNSYGVRYTLFVILPIIMAVVISLVYFLWDFALRVPWTSLKIKPLRYYGYFLFVTRIVLFFNNVAIALLLFKEKVL